MKGTLFCAVLALAYCPAISGQGIPRFELAPGPLELGGPAEAHRFIKAVGERGGIWGFESGRLEAWVYPLKILRDLRLQFQLQGGTVRRGEDIVRRVRVFPHMVQLEYEADGFRVVETLFTPRQEAGSAILLDVRAPRTMAVTARFRREMVLMAPAEAGPHRESLWDAERRWIRLSEPADQYSALIGSPAAVAAVVADPELSLEVRITPEEAARNFIPIVIAGGIRGTYDPEVGYRRMIEGLSQLYAAALKHYASLDSGGTQFETPDAAVNESLRWGRVSLEQLKVCNPTYGCSYVSGYGPSGAGNAPRWVWFFDEPDKTAWALLPNGQTDALKTSLRFINRYQREDGLVMHEVRQSTGLKHRFAYMHADDPLWFLITMGYFYRFTGDEDFIREIWPSIRKAYHYLLTLEDPADALLRIPPGMWGSMERPSFSKDAAMAALWIASLRAMQDLGGLMKDARLVADCRRREPAVAASLERRFWNPELNYYTYGLDLEGKPVTYLNPMIGYSAWFGSLPDDRARAVLERLATANFLADWGQRNMSFEDPRYSEGSYSIGSVWPYTTVGNILGHYRHRNAVQGFLTWQSMLAIRGLSSRGAMPEAMAGSAYRFYDGGVPHQMFSESALTSGLVHGVMGLDLDVPRRKLTWAPQLPSQWAAVVLRQFPFGRQALALRLKRSATELSASVESSSAEAISLEFQPALPAGSRVLAVLADGRPVQYETIANAMDLQVMTKVAVRGRSNITIRYRPGLSVEVPWELPRPGDPSRNLRVLRAAYSDRRLEMTVEGRPDRPYLVRLHTPWRVTALEGGKLAAATSGAPTVLELAPPEAARAKVDKAGYVRWTVRAEAGP